MDWTQKINPMKQTVIMIYIFTLPWTLMAQFPIGVEIIVPADTSIAAINNNTNNPMAVGGYFETNSTNGIAVKGAAVGDNNADGVGGHFVSTGSDGRGVVGEATFPGSNAQTFGGLFRSLADNSFGVWSTASDGKNSYGVVGESRGEDAHGVSGSATGLNGKAISAYYHGENGYGVYAESISDEDVLNVAGYFLQQSKFHSGTQIGTGSYAVKAISRTTNCTDCGTGVFGTGGAGGIVGISTGTNFVGIPGYYSYGVYGGSAQGSGVRGHGAAHDFNAVGPGLDYHSSSSARWKNNVENISEPINKLESLRGVTFTWDEEHGGHEDIGFIAEEVGAILPEIVGFELNGVDASGLDYSRITPLLVECAKAMRQEYLTLLGGMSRQIQSYEEHISKLEEMNESLIRQIQSK